MVIETIEDNEDAQGEKLITVTGRSIEKIMMERLAKASMSGLDIDAAWSLTGTPAQIVRYIFDQIMVQGRLSLLDILPFYTPAIFFTEDTK